MSYNGILLSAYGCGISYVVYPAVQALTSLPTYIDTLLPPLTSAMPSASTSTSPVSSTAPINKKLSHGDIAGIAIGAYFFIGIVVNYLVLCWYKRRKRNPQQSSAVDSTRPEPESPRSQPRVLSSATAMFGLDGKWRSELGPKDKNNEDRFMAFLASFGSDGILLRELIMLASLRLAPETSRNYWLTSGERGRLRDAINAQTTYAECAFLGAFMREASTVQSTDIFQTRLEKLRLVNVEYQYAKGTRPASQQSWFVDGRIWRISEDRSYARHFTPEFLLEVFLEVFTEMPCKDISPLAERQREIYYYHAHQAIVRLYRDLVWSHVHPRDMRQVVLVILQILSHRFQKDDEALLGFAKENLPESGLHPDWNMILLVAELKATISTNCENFSQLRDKVFQVVEISVTRSDSSPRAKGLSGWLLVELLDAAEAQDCVELVDAVVQTGKQWMQRLLVSKLSSLEHTMLCRAFARFEVSVHPEPQPRQYDLLFGYQLSRAGCTERAEELLLSGLEYYASSPMSTRIWSYRFELVSLMLRAGRWSEAQAWLASARRSAIYRNRAIHDTDFWMRSGECGETFILLGLYQADCDMAMGKLEPAEDRLKDTMEETFFVRDYYIRALRLALRTRLLNVQMWQEVWERATVTARDLIEDTIASGHCLSTTRSSCSVIVIVLTLINKLLWVGDVLAAARLLESLKRFEDADHNVLPLDIKLYLERRRAAVSHLLSFEGSLRHKRHLEWTFDGSSGYVRHLKESGANLEESGANAEDAITSAPPVDPVEWVSHPNSLRARLPTDYKWSSELEHARFPTPEADELDYLKVQSDEGKVLDTVDNGSARRAKPGAMRERILRLGGRRGAVHRGNPVAERLTQAPPPPSHEPYALEELTRGGSEREIPLYQIS